VQEGLRERLAAADVLSYRVLWFEREGPRFVAPARYPALAAATVSTHDLPTIAGWWGGVDIAEKATLGLLDAAGVAAAQTERAEAKRALSSAIAEAGAADGRAPSPDAPHDASTTAAVHRYAGATASALVLVQADDLADETTALNLPGTDRERPNWRRKVHVGVEDLWQTPSARLTVSAFSAGDGPAGRASRESRE